MVSELWKIGANQGCSEELSTREKVFVNLLVPQLFNIV